MTRQKVIKAVKLTAGLAATRQQDKVEHTMMINSIPYILRRPYTCAIVRVSDESSVGQPGYWS
jgi:hypothetical protein